MRPTNKGTKLCLHHSRFPEMEIRVPVSSSQKGMEALAPHLHEKDSQGHDTCTSTIGDSYKSCDEEHTAAAIDAMDKFSELLSAQCSRKEYTELGAASGGLVLRRRRRHFVRDHSCASGALGCIPRGSAAPLASASNRTPLRTSDDLGFLSVLGGGVNGGGCFVRVSVQEDA